MMINLVKSLVFSLLLSIAARASAQDLQTIILKGPISYPDYADGEALSIPQGKVIEIVYAFGTFTATSNGGEPASMLLTDKTQFPSYVCGPITLKASTATIITYRLKDNIPTTTTIPTSAVVIPSDATGPVNIILESSTDLVTWTAANPGTYGASTSRRFFRVRAVNQ